MTSATAAERYFFPPPPRPDAHEWMGTFIGVSNILTRLRSPVPVIQVDPASAEGFGETVRRIMAGRDLHITDLILHGVRIRLNTNSFHLASFARENFHSPAEWLQASGYRPPEHPRLQAYAFAVPGGPEGAFYAPDRDAVYLFNTTCYAQLQVALLMAVAPLLTNVQLVRGSSFQAAGRGVWIGAEETYPASGIRMHSAHFFFLRFAQRRRDGGFVTPLDDRRTNPKAIPVLSLDHERFDLPVAEIDFDAVGAFAFTAEKNFYHRTDVVRHHPGLTAAVLESKLENVPDAAGDASSRLAACEESRAMLSPASVFGVDQVFSNPLEPMKVDLVVGVDALADAELVSKAARISERRAPQGRAITLRDLEGL